MLWSPQRMLMLSLQPFILLIYYTDYDENLVDINYLDNNDMDDSVRWGNVLKLVYA